MSIPEDMIVGCMNMLLTASQAGATMHHLHVVGAPPGAVGPLGVADKEQLRVAVYAIAPVGPDIDPEQFVGQGIRKAGLDHARQGHTVLFAGLSTEAWWVEREDFDDQARRLQKAGRLFDHPAMVEVTVVYGAARDGRRWRGRQYLTGPKAGTAVDVELLVGQPAPGEGRVGNEPLVRRLVGMAR